MSIVRVPFSLTSGGLGGYVPAGAIWLDGSADYLSWTPSGAADSDTIWTASAWVKRAGLGSLQRVFVAGDVATGNNYDAIYFNANDKLNWQLYRSGVLQGQYTTTAVFRDTSAWMHVHVTRSGATVTISVNGEAITAFDTSTAPDPGDQSMFMQSGEPTTISYQPWGGTNRYNGYIAEAIMLDGTASAVSNFGETDTNGNWVPIDPSGLTFGTNGFWLDFADSADLGKPNGDTASEPSASGDWTGTNIASFSFADGKITQSTTNDIMIYSSQTFAGDFEIEFIPNNATSDTVTFGVCESAETGNLNQSSSSGYAAGVTNGTWFSLWGDKAYIKSGGSLVDDASGGFSWSAGDKIKLKRSSGTITVYKNGSLAHTFSQTNSNTMMMLRGGGNQGGVGYVTSEVQWADNGTLGNRFFLTSMSSANATNDNPADDATNGYGNFMLWNPLEPGTKPTFSNGNTTESHSASDVPAFGNWVFSDGLWQIELTADVFTAGDWIGVCNEDFAQGTDIAGSSDTWVYKPSTGYKSNGTGDPGTAYGSGASATDRINIALDMDQGDGSNKIWIGVNGTWENSGDPAAGTGAMYSNLPARVKLVQGSRSSSAGTFTINLSLTDALETGFKQPVTYSLPAPTVTDPSTAFNTVLYEGNGTAVGSGGNAITGVGFQPDFVWIKNRDAADEHMLYDAVRGATKDLNSDGSGKEATDTEGLSTFDSDGFTVGSNVAVNTNAESYVAWCMKAGGSGSSNTDGSITSTVSVAAHGGFSIGTFTGNATDNATVGHGLTIGAPNMLILKNTTTDGWSWRVYHDGIGTPETNLIILDTTAAASARSTALSDVAPGASVFTLGTDTGTNGSGDTMLFYAFARTPGLIGIGSYTGNGSTDGPYVVVDDGGSGGFRPAWVMIKRADAGSENWSILDNQRDPYNVADAPLFPNAAVAESAVTWSADFTANGFKVRSATTDNNTSGGTYIYLAFAEYPFGGEGVAQAKAR